MTTPAPSPDQAKPTKRKRAVIVQLSYHGALVGFHYAADAEMTVHELEQCIDTMLSRPGWAEATTQAAATPAPRRPLEAVRPNYNGDGEACCTVHRDTPLRQGQRGGWYCPARAKGNEAANEKGYCAIRFED